MKVLYPNHFNCRHPKTPENTIKGGVGYRHGRCRYCKTGVLTFELTFRCGHLRSPENSVRSGYAGHTCRECKAGRDSGRPRSGVRPEAKQKEIVAAAPPAVALYRAEKAKRAERLKARPELATAKAAYQAALQREQDARKGGRPPKPGGGKNIRVGAIRNQFPNVQSDPKDALLNSVQPYYGAA